MMTDQTHFVGDGCDPPHTMPSTDSRTIDEQIADAVSNPNLSPESLAAIESVMRETYRRLVEQANEAADDG